MSSTAAANLSKDRPRQPSLAQYRNRLDIHQIRGGDITGVTELLTGPAPVGSVVAHDIGQDRGASGDRRG
jgi:hypothetical protein